MNLEMEIEATIADFNLNDMPARRTAKIIMQLIKDSGQEHQTAEVLESNSTTLLSCPFCGYQPIGLSLYEVTVETAPMFGMWRVGCGVCGFHSYRQTESEAVKLWNKRGI